MVKSRITELKIGILLYIYAQNACLLGFFSIFNYCRFLTVCQRYVLSLHFSSCSCLQNKTLLSVQQGFWAQSILLSQNYKKWILFQTQVEGRESPARLTATTESKYIQRAQPVTPYTFTSGRKQIQFLNCVMFNAQVSHYTQCITLLLRKEQLLHTCHEGIQGERSNSSTH